MAELNDFELTDQEAKKRIYRFPKTKVTVMTVADRPPGQKPSAMTRGTWPSSTTAHDKREETISL
jgi:hypothetical protein